MKITKKEAYKVMLIFLDDLYKKTKSDDIGGLLGGFSLLSDGSTADPAAWTDWDNILQKENIDELLNIKQIIISIKDFFKFHKEKFGFDLDIAINEFDDISSNKEQFEKYVENILADDEIDEKIHLVN